MTWFALIANVAFAAAAATILVAQWDLYKEMTHQPPVGAYVAAILLGVVLGLVVILL